MQIDIPKRDPTLQRTKRYPEYKEIYLKLPQFIQKILHTHRLRPKKVTLWRKGISSFVFLMEDKKKLAIKISPRYSLYTEIYFFQKAKKAGFPVPKVIVVDTTKKLIPYDFHITEWVDGETPDEFRGKDLYACAFELGRMFARMHKVHTNGFGFPKPNGKWSHQSWSSALRDFIYRETSPNQIQKLFGKRVANVAHKVIKDKKMEIESPALIHGDTGEDQFVVEKKDKWIIRGILDPSDYIAGDPMADIAGAMITWNKKSYRSGFYDGYVSVHKLDENEVYRLNRLLFLNQIWAASIVYKTNKKDGRYMAKDAIHLAKKFRFLTAHSTSKGVMGLKL